MTVELKPCVSSDVPAVQHLTREVEGKAWSLPVKHPQEADDEIVFPSLSAPPTWPRIFPSL